MNLGMRCLPVLIFLLLVKAGTLFPNKDMIRYSAVPLGSKVTLLGLLFYGKECSKAWFKDDVPIRPASSSKYTFLNNGATLVIHDFSVTDVGFYFFIHSRNNKSEQMMFNLQLVSERGHHWYENNSKHVGTVIGMLFLFLIMLALVYYCCSKDVDTVFPSLQLRNMAVKRPLYSNNNENIYSGGMNFAPGVHFASSGGRRKTSKEVRKESLNMLGIASRQKSSKSIKRNKSKKEFARGVSLLVMTSPPSPTLL